MPNTFPNNDWTDLLTQDWKRSESVSRLPLDLVSGQSNLLHSMPWGVNGDGVWVLFRLTK